MDRNTYIDNQDDVQAMEQFLHAIGEIPAKCETISVLDSVGRMTYQAIFAKYCDPVYNASAMDGIAVVAEQTFGTSEVNPLLLQEHQDFIFVNTGNEIKEPFNAVIMIEQVLLLEQGQVQIIAPAYPWQHIRTVGESIVAGDMIIPSKHKIRPVDLGALLGGGITTLKVYAKPTVGIIPTGQELIEDPALLQPGKLMESNSRVFSELTKEYGGIANRYQVVGDEPELLAASVAQAVAENDLVIVNAGSSAGSKDYTVTVLEQMGTVLSHGMAIKPGKPTILALVDGKPVVGIPGYPVSAYLVFELIMKPLILAYSGQSQYPEVKIEATLTKRLVSSFKNAELLRVAVGFVQGQFVTTPLARGAAAVMSMVKADGLIKVPRLTEGIEAGAQVTVTLLKPLERIKETLVVTGSHDLIVDILADHMAISSAHVGSMGGIMALKRKECHLAPIHLLDETTGVYNTSYVKKYFPHTNMALIHGVGRIQGIMVAKGNPLGIVGIEDLQHRKIKFANRQRGSGTRILLDYLLQQKNILSEQINGYEKEYSTHMAVAISVQSGVAQAGLGVYTAAKAMDLDFIPLMNEQYDFLVPIEYLEEDAVKQLVQLLQSEKIKEKFQTMGGYDTSLTGSILHIDAVLAQS